MDPNMNQLLKWSIENSTTSQPATSPQDITSPPSPSRALNPNALQALFGGPSDADLMKSSMATILSSTVPLDQKLIAFDNFEQLIETIDNANNLESCGLWTPLVGLLGDGERELRRMAAWCVGTAVQNNARAQERLLIFNAIPTLLSLALSDPDEGVRRKAVYALSSEVRNYQPGMDALIRSLPKGLKAEVGDGKKMEAGDMGVVDGLIGRLRESKHIGES